MSVSCLRTIAAEGVGSHRGAHASEGPHPEERAVGALGRGGRGPRGRLCADPATDRRGWIALDRHRRGPDDDRLDVTGVAGGVLAAGLGVLGGIRSGRCRVGSGQARRGGGLRRGTGHPGLPGRARRAHPGRALLGRARRLHPGHRLVPEERHQPAGGHGPRPGPPQPRRGGQRSPGGRVGPTPLPSRRPRSRSTTCSP